MEKALRHEKQVSLFAISLRSTPDLHLVVACGRDEGGVKMPRKAKIAHISERDRAAFRMLWNVQHIPRNLLNLSDNRLKTYLQQGLVERCFNVKGEEIICCTKKGRTYIAKLPEFWDRKPYASSHAAKHNCELARIYSTLTPEQQINWRTEKEVAELYNDRMDELRERDYDRWCYYMEREYSPCDCMILDASGGVEQLIEVYTNNYGELDVKITCSEVLEAPLNFYKV